MAAGALASVFYYANVWEYSGHDTYFFQHTWTLALEEQFYLVWPALLLLITRWRRAAWLIAGSYVALDVVDGLLNQPAVLHTYVRAAGLPLGCALAFALRHEGVRSALAKVAVPALAAIVVIACLRGDLHAITDSWPLGLPSLLTIPVIAALLGAGALTTALSHPVAVWIGRRSYGLYLWHFPILSAFINHSPHRVPMFVRCIFGIALAFVAAAVSYGVIEKPFLRRKQRYEPRRLDEVAT